MKEEDSLRRFIFSDLGIRGEWVSLNKTWQTVKNKHQYPAIIEQQLGMAMAAVVLLAVTIKFKGSMILQTQGNGALRMLVAQCDHDGGVRGMARYDAAEILKTQQKSLYGEGRLVLTIEQENGEPYQGIVELRGNDLALSVQAYFQQSEQLATRIYLFANENQAGGLLIQELPGANNEQENWQRIEMLTNTVTEQEFFDLPCQDMLYRLYNEEKVRLFDAEAVQFRCRCSQQKIERTLLSLGRESLHEILSERDDIVVDCEFCNHQYQFDKVDVERILSQKIHMSYTSKTQH